jgi:methylmalonyl-CoA/ethylmalonyl-CoA epimerase
MDERFRLHHIGILVPDVARASERLVKQFGYSPDTPVLEDPQQTAIAQFLRLPGADHWTELIAPNGPDSKLRGAIDRRRGGMHHVCYQVDDIDAACAHLHEQSMMVIAQPVPGIAFDGRRIAWLIDRDYFLVELVESGEGALCLPPRQTESSARQP